MAKPWRWLAHPVAVNLTLLRLLAGLETATRGELRIEGMVVNELRERNVAMVFQDYALYPHP